MVPAVRIAKAMIRVTISLTLLSILLSSAGISTSESMPPVYYFAGFESGTLEGYALEQNLPYWPPDYWAIGVDSSTKHSGNYSLLMHIRHNSIEGHQQELHFGAKVSLPQVLPLPNPDVRQTFLDLWLFRDEQFIDGFHVKYYAIEVVVSLARASQNNQFRLHYVLQVINVDGIRPTDSQYDRYLLLSPLTSVGWIEILRDLSSDVKDNFLDSDGDSGVAVVGIELRTSYRSISVLSGPNGNERPETKMHFDDVFLGSVVPIAPHEGFVSGTPDVLFQVYAGPKQGVSAVQIILNGTAGDLEYDDTSGYWRTTAHLYDGHYRWHAKVRYLQELVLESRSLSLIVDNTPPSLEIAQFPSDRVHSYTSVMVTVLARDEISTVAYVTLQYSIDGGATWINATITRNGEKYSAEIPQQPAGTRVLYKISSADLLGNTISRLLEYRVEQNYALKVTAQLPNGEAVAVPVRVTSTDLAAKIVLHSSTSRPPSSLIFQLPKGNYSLEATWLNFTDRTFISVSGDQDVRFDFFSLSATLEVRLSPQYSAWATQAHTISMRLVLDTRGMKTAGKSHTVAISGVDSLQVLSEGALVSLEGNTWVITFPKDGKLIITALWTQSNDARLFRNYYAQVFPVIAIDERTINPSWDITLVFPGQARIVNLAQLAAGYKEPVHSTENDHLNLTYKSFVFSWSGEGGVIAVSYENAEITLFFSSALFTVVAASVLITFAAGHARLRWFLQRGWRFVISTASGSRVYRSLELYLLIALLMITLSYMMSVQTFSVLRVNDVEPRLMVAAFVTLLSFCLVFVASYAVVRSVVVIESLSPIPLLGSAIVAFLAFEITSWVLQYSSNILGVPLGYHGGAQALTGPYLLGFVGGGNIPRLIAAFTGGLFAVAGELHAARIRADMSVVLSIFLGIAFGAFLPRVGQVIYETIFIFIGGEPYGFYYGSLIDHWYSSMAIPFRVAPASRGVIMWFAMAVAIAVLPRLGQGVNSLLIAVALPLYSRGLMRTGQIEYVPLTFESVYAGAAIGFLIAAFSLVVDKLSKPLIAQLGSTSKTRLDLFAAAGNKTLIILLIVAAAFFVLSARYPSFVFDTVAVLSFVGACRTAIKRTGVNHVDDFDMPSRSTATIISLQTSASGVIARLWARIGTAFKTNNVVFVTALAIFAYYIGMSSALNLSLRFLAGYLSAFVLPGYMLTNLIIAEDEEGRIGRLSMLILYIAMSTAVYPALYLAYPNTKTPLDYVSVLTISLGLILSARKFLKVRTFLALKQSGPSS